MVNVPVITPLLTTLSLLAFASWKGVDTWIPDSLRSFFAPSPTLSASLSLPPSPASAKALPPHQLRVAPVSLSEAVVQHRLSGGYGVYAIGWVDSSSTAPPDIVCEGCGGQKVLNFSTPAPFPMCNGIHKIPCAWSGSMWYSYVAEVTFDSPEPVLHIGGDSFPLNIPENTVVAAAMFDACMSPNAGGLMNCFADVNNFQVMHDRLAEINESSHGGINLIIWGGDNGYGRNQPHDVEGNLPHVYATRLGGLDFLTTAPLFMLMGNHEYDQDAHHGCSTGDCMNDAGAAPYVAFGMTSAVKSWFSDPDALCNCSSSACSSSVFFNGGTQPVDWKYTLGFYAVGDLGVITFDGRWNLRNLLDASQGDPDFKAAVQSGLKYMGNAGVLENVWVLGHWNNEGQGGASSAVDGRREFLQFASKLGIGEYTTSTWFAFSGHAHTNTQGGDTDYCLGGNGQSWAASPVGCGCASKVVFNQSHQTSVEFTSPGGKCPTHCTTTGR